MTEKKEEQGCLKWGIGKFFVVLFVYLFDQWLLDGHITRIVASFIMSEFGGLFGITS